MQGEDGTVVVILQLCWKAEPQSTLKQLRSLATPSYGGNQSTSEVHEGKSEGPVWQGWKWMLALEGRRQWMRCHMGQSFFSSDIYERGAHLSQSSYKNNLDSVSHPTPVNLRLSSEAISSP